MKTAIIAAALLLSACATATPQRMDFLGNVMPVQCYDVSDINLTIVEAPEAELRKIAPTKKKVLYGVWLSYVYKPHEIWIKTGLTPSRRAEVLEHEKCHEKMWRLTGIGEWH